MKYFAILSALIYFDIILDDAKAQLSIVNGTLAKIGQFPFAAAVINREYNKSTCSATMIAPKYALSGAYCFVGVRTGLLLVGDVESSPPQKPAPPSRQTRKIIKIIRHPQARTAGDKVNYIYNLAVLELNREVISSEGVSWIPLAKTDLADNSKCVAIGFGFHRKAEGEHDGKLRYGTFKVDKSQCHPLLTCIKSTSQGIYWMDAGGPVVNRNPPYILYALISKHMHPTNIGMCVSISQNRKWIKSVIRSDVLGTTNCAQTRSFNLIIFQMIKIFVGLLLI
ncbi:coagulation factor X-like [Hermetia illucens]|uniref:coagulation factor X-like n=1 Tax=Hermetia illucens TaxID=343691 RepID=UPI0018CC52AB|nr:coagulation factor X-like [Hermetia illucens]